MNYMERLTFAVLSGGITFPRGAVSMSMVAHDDWCGVYKRKPCSCVPDITVEIEGRKYAIDPSGGVKEAS